MFIMGYRRVCLRKCHRLYASGEMWRKMGKCVGDLALEPPQRFPCQVKNSEKPRRMFEVPRVLTFPGGYWHSTRPRRFPLPLFLTLLRFLDVPLTFLTFPLTSLSVLHEGLPGAHDSLSDYPSSWDLLHLRTFLRSES